MTNVREQYTLTTIEVLVAFRAQERRSPVTHGLHDIVCEPSFLASVADTASLKNSHTWPRRPERPAQMRSILRHVSMKAVASANQPPLSKSTARKKHVSSKSIG